MGVVLDDPATSASAAREPASASAQVDTQGSEDVQGSGGAPRGMHAFDDESQAASGRSDPTASASAANREGLQALHKDDAAAVFAAPSRSSQGGGQRDGSRDPTASAPEASGSDAERSNSVMSGVSEGDRDTHVEQVRSLTCSDDS